MALPHHTPSLTFVLMYASLARAPEFAMNLASRMAASSVAYRDVETVRRWSLRYDQLHDLYRDDSEDAWADEETSASTRRSAAV